MIAAGELIISGLPAGEPDRDTRDLLRAASFAGYLLLRRNTSVPDELVRLVESLDPHSGPPPIIAIDEEGGMVSRLDHLGLRGPSAMATAAAGDPAGAYAAAHASGRVLRSLGINVVLGPCLDVLTEPSNPVICTRSFGDDPTRVAAFGLEALRGYRELGLATVIKHFPGHGATREDSHVRRPAVPGGLDALRRCELRPFQAALEAGAGAVMTAHVRYPEATPHPDEDLPATLSPFWLQDVLRQELGFGGIVVSDAVEMKGVAGGRQLEAVIGEGLHAGIDLFICEDLENALRVRGHLLALIDAGGPTAARVEAAAERVRAWRQDLQRGPSGESPTRTLLEVNAALDGLQQRAVALLGGPAGGLPLDPDAPLLLVLPRELDSSRPIDVEFLRSAMQERFPRGRVIALEAQPTEGEVRLLGELVAANPGLGVVLGLLGAQPESRARQAASAIGAGPGARIGVALHCPADVRVLPAAWTRLVTYGFGRPALRALLDVLAGRTEPRGELLCLGPEES